MGREGEHLELTERQAALVNLEIAQLAERLVELALARAEDDGGGGDPRLRAAARLLDVYVPQFDGARFRTAALNAARHAVLCPENEETSSERALLERAHEMLAHEVANARFSVDAAEQLEARRGARASRS